jgi:hypothetical protein
MMSAMTFTHPILTNEELRRIGRCKPNDRRRDQRRCEMVLARAGRLGYLVSAGRAYPALMLSNGSAARAFNCHCRSTVISAGDYPPYDAADEERSSSKYYGHREFVLEAFWRGL